MKTIQTILVATVLGAAFAAPGAAQERPPLPGETTDRGKELEELFAKVELRLQRMSELLGEASAGDVGALKRLGSAGIDELIREAETPPASGSTQGLSELIQATRGHGEKLLEEIDRVLEIAREQQQQQQQGGSSGSGQRPQQSGGEQPQQGQTPAGSRQMEGERAPRPGEEQEQGQQPQPGEGNDPRDNRDDPPGPGEQQQGEAPPGAEIGAPNGREENGQWGDLPVHVRRVFQNGVSDDVPPRYRDWIDAYHRRLSTRRPR